MDDGRQSGRDGARPHADALGLAALLLCNVALAFGPLLVRLSGAGAVAAGMWRLALAVPFLIAVAALAGQRPWASLRTAPRGVLIALLFAAFFFAADLAAWHAGILLTKLGNATLLGNVASFIFAAYGLWLARRWPDARQGAALLLAPLGMVLLMVGSVDLGGRYVRGDLLALLAGLFYFFYLLLVDRARAVLPPLPLLAFLSAAGALMLFLLALAMGERLAPARWDMMLLLALSSQLLGQGLLVYALGRVSPLVVGIAFLIQPALSALLGWAIYGERLGMIDALGALCVAAALVLVSLRPPPRPA